MIDFYLRCHNCGGIQFTVLAVKTTLNKAVFNVVCVSCGYESTISTEDNRHKAEDAKV